jgi:hypothetical protein
MCQPACEWLVCKRIWAKKPIPNWKRPSRAYQRSLRAATVERIVIKGDRAAARFTNDKLVELDGVGGWWPLGDPQGWRARGPGLRAAGVARASPPRSSRLPSHARTRHQCRGLRRPSRPKLGSLDAPPRRNDASHSWCDCSKGTASRTPPSKLGGSVLLGWSVDGLGTYDGSRNGTPPGKTSSGRGLARTRSARARASASNSSMVSPLRSACVDSRTSPRSAAGPARGRTARHCSRRAAAHRSRLPASACDRTARARPRVEARARSCRTPRHAAMIAQADNGVTHPGGKVQPNSPYGRGTPLVVPGAAIRRKTARGAVFCDGPGRIRTSGRRIMSPLL